MQEDIVFCNRLEHSHLHFPWCRGGDWQRERNKPRPIFLAFPTLHLPPAASTTHLPCHPKQNRPLGISLAPKTQLRHQGKDRPVWQGCLAPRTDAGALNGRGARNPQAQRPPGPPYLVTPVYPQDKLPAGVGKGSAPPAVALWPSGPFSTPTPICSFPIK